MSKRVILSIFDDDDDNDATVQEVIVTHILNIIVVAKSGVQDNPKQTGIAIEGSEVHFGIPDVAHACTFLMGLSCALEVRYPKKTLQVFSEDFS